MSSVRWIRPERHVYVSSVRWIRPERHVYVTLVSILGFLLILRHVYVTFGSQRVKEYKLVIFTVAYGVIENFVNSANNFLLE